MFLAPPLANWRRPLEAGAIKRLTEEELDGAIRASQFNRDDVDMVASARHAAHLNEQLAQQFKFDPRRDRGGGWLPVDGGT